MIPNILHPGENEICDVRMVHLDRVGRARDESLPEDQLERMARTFKILGDPNRLRMVLALRSGEMCVCDLAAFVGISESAVSHQLRQLRDLALVKRRRAGQILYYSLDDDHVAELLTLAQVHMAE